MKYKVFVIPVDGSVEHENALNRFIENHSIRNITRELAQCYGNSVWTFLVEYEGGKAVGESTSHTKTNNKPEKYKPEEVLNETELKRFYRLREARKVVYNAMGQMPYNIATDQQLYDLSHLETITLETVKDVASIPEKQREKFIVPLIKAYNENEAKGASH